MAVITYDSSEKPYKPCVRLRITDTFSKLDFQSFTAVVDSGADYTCIPKSIADQVSGYSYEEEYAEEFTGNRVRVKLIRMLEASVDFLDERGDVCFSGRYHDLRLPIVAAGLLGWDILNGYVCVLNAPKLVGELIPAHSSSQIRSKEEHGQSG